MCSLFFYVREIECVCAIVLLCERVRACVCNCACETVSVSRQNFIGEKSTKVNEEIVVGLTRASNVIRHLCVGTKNWGDDDWSNFKFVDFRGDRK